MTASTSPTPASRSWSRMSGLVSTNSRKPPSETRIEARLRRLRGLSGSHAPQSLPIRGTPDEVPHPRMRTFMSDVTSWRRLTEKAVEIGARRRGERVRPLAAQRGEKGKRIGDEGGFAGLAAMREGGEEGGRSEGHTSELQSLMRI